MPDLLHLTSGDCAGNSLAKSGVAGEVFVWHDILYDGPRNPGWPTEETLKARARFLEHSTAGGLAYDYILATLKNQYRRLVEAPPRARIVLWFDACLFDQAMLAHILTCLHLREMRQVELLCVDAFPGIDPYHGLGQLQPAQMAGLYGRQRPLTEAQFQFAVVADRAFATQDSALFAELVQSIDPPLPWIPAAVRRWRQEQPDPLTGLGRLEYLALEAIRSGCRTPGAIFAAVAIADPPPRYWGDTTLWAKINGLAERTPPLVRIAGPAPRLPQWESELKLGEFKINPAESQ